MTADKKPVTSRRAFEIVLEKDNDMPSVLAKLIVDPAMNAVSTIQSYQGNVLGDDINPTSTVDEIRGITERIKGGDLSDLEGMLISQAISLQTMFTSLSRRAQTQGIQRNLEAFMGLAFKAQAQSRSTIQALVELKFPRQVSFVKQANINNGGQQQVNNGIPAPAGNAVTAQSKLLEPNDGEWMDTRAPSTAGQTDPDLEAMGKGDRAAKSRRKGRRVP